MLTKVAAKETWMVVFMLIIWGSSVGMGIEGLSAIKIHLLIICIQGQSKK